MVGARVVSAPDPRLGNPEWSDNWTLGRGLRFELLEAETGRVLICQTEVAAVDVAAFEPPDGFGHALVGAARADMAFFARSPGCLLYTSPSPRDQRGSRMPSSA